MKTLSLITGLILSATIGFTNSAKANSSNGECPPPDEVLEKVQEGGNVTTLIYLSETCNESFKIANTCQQQGMDEYNRRLALAAQKQCESEFYRKDVINTKQGRNIISRYLNLKYQCGQLRKNADTEITMCKAEAARFMMNQLNYSKAKQN